MTDSTSLRVRAVRGRVIDPYRGTPDEAELAERFAPRKAEAASFDDIIAVLKGLGVEVVGQGRRFKLKRTDETLRIAFASAAPRVSLDDTSFEGDPLLAIDVLHAFVPLFGALELCVGDYRELIDGHEAVHVIAARYRAHWIAESLERAKKMGPVKDTAPPKPAATTPKPAPPPQPIATPAARPRRGDGRTLLIGGVVLVAAILGYRLYDSHASQAKVGQYCARDRDCHSDECLPTAELVRTVAPGVRLDGLRTPHASHGPGVCTEECFVNSDCPYSMVCDDVKVYTFGDNAGTPVNRCLPR